MTKKPAKVDVNEEPGVNAEEQDNNSEDTSPPRSTGSVDLSFLSYESQSVENRSTLVKKDSSDELLNEVIKVRSTQETILTDIKYIKGQLDQYLTLTQEIVSVLKNQNFTTLTAPENIPNFPLETENEFNLFEIYIKDQDKYSYMVKLNLLHILLIKIKYILSFAALSMCCYWWFRSATNNNEYT